MARFTRETMLVDPDSALGLLDAYGNHEAFVVYPWDVAPSPLKEAFYLTSGKEDWLVIAPLALVPNGVPPSWVLDLDAIKDPDVYDLGPYLAFIGTH